MIDPNFTRGLNLFYPKDDVIKGSPIEPFIDKVAQAVFEKMYKDTADWLKDKEVISRETTFIFACYGTLVIGFTNWVGSQCAKTPHATEPVKVVEKIMGYLVKKSLPPLLTRFDPDERYHLQVSICNVLKTTPPESGIELKIRNKTALSVRIKATPINPDSHFIRALNQLYPEDGVIKGSRIEPLIDEIAQVVFNKVYEEIADWLKDEEVIIRERKVYHKCYDNLVESCLNLAGPLSAESTPVSDPIKMVEKVMEYLEKNSLPPLLTNFGPDPRYHFEGSIFRDNMSEVEQLLTHVLSALDFSPKDIEDKMKNETNLFVRVKAIPITKES